MISRSPSPGDGADRNPNELELGWWQANELPFGFAAQHQQTHPPSDDPLNYAGDGHLLTVAPTGCGKGRDVLIPTLLTSLRSMICLDVKGELYSVTARRRRELGHHVIGIDPFNLVLKQSDGLNPLDLMHLPGADPDTEAAMLASMLATGNTSTRERFWDLHGTGFLSGLIAHYGSHADPKKRNLLEARDLLLCDDPMYQTAVVADSKPKSKLAYREICGFLNQAERDTRPSVLATTTSYLKPLSSDLIRPAIANSTFSLEQVINGEPLTIYLIFPVEKLVSHAGLLRILLGTLLAAILKRRFRPESRTLFLIDECAQLGHFDLLKPTITLMRGFGLQCWLFFQSLHQLKAEYEKDWRTILDNIAVTQTFGLSNRLMAEDWGTYFGMEPEELMTLEENEQWLHLPGHKVVKARRFNYLTDHRFRGMYDPNPLCQVRRNSSAGGENIHFDTNRGELSYSDTRSLDSRKMEPPKVDPSHLDAQKVEPPPVEPPQSDPKMSESKPSKPKKAKPTKSKPRKTQPKPEDPTMNDPEAAQPPKEKRRRKDPPPNC